jgi:hypothetical protein
MDKYRASTIALAALVWILEQPDRANRLLDLTGLSPDGLRAGAGDAGLQAAVLGFLGNHEPDLVACAAAIDYDPATLIRAKDVLES